MTFCPCNTFHETSSGGLIAGSSATLSTDIREGGVCAGGTASVWMAGNTWDGFAAVWPLGEISTGAAGEFADLSSNNLDGTGGGGNTSFLTTLDDGVFCLDSQYFDGKDFIHFPKDNISTSGEFSVSLWIKRADNSFGEKWFFSRGVQTSSTKWNFALGLSYIGQLQAKIQLSEDVVARVFSSDKLIPERWYHVAVSWKPQDALRLYLDGSIVSEAATSQASTVAYSGSNYSQAGRLSNGGGFVGNVQEIRLKPSIESDAYFAAEHDNFCQSSFCELGNTIDEAVFA
ncbi:LamG-like jellyroll fold domain-containing protein [Thalassoglobus sp.]|uniref:LamG-like jellyroll fold domain-containing protein n=1 Tax=Thalassoglobus sp. TaxID=2795869 RepID=UPI003AA93A78